MNRAYWENQPTDKPWLLNGFAGTWKFSDHTLIPDEIRTFLLEYFAPAERFRKISLDDINRVMNEVWEGPGSMPKLCDMYHKMQTERRENGGLSRRPIGGLPAVKTIDEYEDDEFEYELDIPDDESDE